MAASRAFRSLQSTASRITWSIAQVAGSASSCTCCGVTNGVLPGARDAGQAILCVSGCDADFVDGGFQKLAGRVGWFIEHGVLLVDFNLSLICGKLRLKPEEAGVKVKIGFGTPEANVMLLTNPTSPARSFQSRT